MCSFWLVFAQRFRNSMLRGTIPYRNVSKFFRTVTVIIKPSGKIQTHVNFSRFLICDARPWLELILIFSPLGNVCNSNFLHFCKNYSSFNISGALKDSALKFSGPAPAPAMSVVWNCKSWGQPSNLASRGGGSNFQIGLLLCAPWRTNLRTYTIYALSL